METNKLRCFQIQYRLKTDSSQQIRTEYIPALNEEDCYRRISQDIRDILEGSLRVFDSGTWDLFLSRLD